MKTTAMLDNISSAIEKAVTDLRGARGPTKKRMRIGDFVTYAISQIEKASHDEPDLAKRRLGALKRSVDDVLASIAKLAAEDLDSARVEVEVVSAFAPTKSDGDTPMSDLTATDDQSSAEISPVSIHASAGDSAFAANLSEVAKALQTMKAELDGPRERPASKTRSSTKKVDGDTGDDWPLDLNTASFRKGVAKADAAPTWGYDPEGLTSPKDG